MADCGRVPASVANPPEPGIARITLNRPDTRNAQSTRFLYALNDAFQRAAADDAVKVVVLRALGPHFSSGHDRREPKEVRDRDTRKDTPVGVWAGFNGPGAEAQMAREKEIYLGFCERWRDLPRPTIAQVHGKVIAGGLMLIWPCDIVIASDDATFNDPTVAMGVGGVEYFMHPFELGPRKAKELLFTADWLTAEEARAIGMVNRVVPLTELEPTVMAMARRIAAKPGFALKLAKEAVNAAEDAMGRPAALKTAFALHQLAHSHNMQVHGMLVDPAGLVPTVQKKRSA